MNNIRQEQNGVSKKPKTQGELLHDLYVWSQLSQEKFANTFDMSRPWLQINFKKKRLYKKVIPAICRAFNIPPEYFENKFKLPTKPMVATEGEVKYSNENAIIKNLTEENERLRKELLELYKQFVDLQKEMNALLQRA